MPLTRCGLLWYQALQRRWRPAACRNQLSAAFPKHQFRQRLFSAGVRRETTFVESFFSTRSPHEVQPSESFEETEDDILSRARAYNIQTIDQLSFESSVVVHGYRTRHSKHARLVDSPPHKTDFYLWTILLDYQRLRFGDKGVRLIWAGLKQRSTLDLPYIGYQGDRFWSAFVSAGTRSHDFLTEVIRYELRHGSKRPRFFLEVVGALLNSETPRSAQSFARMLQIAHRPDKEELYDLFVLATTSNNPESLQIFCDVYGALTPAGLYGKVVSYLCRQGRFSDAWKMHRYLLSHEDLPQTFEDLQPLVLDLVSNHMRLESLLHELAKAGVSMEAQARSFYSQERSLRFGFASENLNIVSSNTLGVRPRTLSDDFVARAFLTATFSFDSILGGLRFFGLKTVGPSSVRAIGLTSANSQELTQRFAKLAASDVDTGSSRFSQLVKKLAQRGEEKLLQNVLHSDQHADVFEDSRLQRRLLLEYYQDGDWPSVERTMAILTVGSDASAANERATNLLLQAALTAGKWSHVRDIMADMKRGKHRFAEITVARMYSAVLSRREPSSLPVLRDDFDELAFLASIWLEVLRSGSSIPVVRWRELVRRLGMYGRLDELEILLVQLLHFYGSGHVPPSVMDGRGDIVEDIDQLLCPALQSAIVAWGFIHTRHLKPVLSAPFGGLKRHPWIRGILFLRRLKDKHHCNIDVKVVRRACLLRLRQLFHFRTESILISNRRSQNRNRVPLGHYVEALEMAWTEPLFSDKAWLLKAVTTHASILSRQTRRVAVRRQFGSHEPNVDLPARESLTQIDAGKGQEQEEESVPGGVVIYGGPLSQAHWGPRQ